MNSQVDNSISAVSTITRNIKDLDEQVENQVSAVEQSTAAVIETTRTNVDELVKM